MSLDYQKNYLISLLSGVAGLVFIFFIHLNAYSDNSSVDWLILALIFLMQISGVIFGILSRNTFQGKLGISFAFVLFFWTFFLIPNLAENGGAAISKDSVKQNITSKRKGQREIIIRTGSANK